jgi:hypothetical protein
MMRGSQVASTSHFFSFATAIDEGMTSVNILKATVMSQSASQKQLQRLDLSTNISKPNCDLSKPAPTLQNQP